MKLSGNWAIKNSIKVKAPDEVISSSGYNPGGWYKTSVPTTVLNVFVKNGTYPDPRIAMNNFLIPDVSDAFNKKMGLSKYSYLEGKENPWKNPYWYWTEVVMPAQDQGKQVWLLFNGINYRADVWVNGHKVAGKNQIVGMFRRFRLNITPYALPGKKNCIAVKVYQVDHPGNPNPGTQFKIFGPTRGNASSIFRDETMKMTGGWDCAPQYVTGIWVFTRTSLLKPQVACPLKIRMLRLPCPCQTRQMQKLAYRQT